MVQQFYEKCQQLYNFPTKEKEAHRVFLFSADLYSECRQTPWNSVAPFDESAKPLLEFGWRVSHVCRDVAQEELRQT